MRVDQIVLGVEVFGLQNIQSRKKLGRTLPKRRGMDLVQILCI